ncbi:MAG: fibronectin type III domain-containing protein [Actinomycetota bacterium]
MRSRLSIALFSSLVLVIAGLLGTAHADNSCSPEIDRSTYKVTICIKAPAPGASISGDVPISATVTVTGTNPGVDSVVFRLKGQGQPGLGVYALVDQTGGGTPDAATFGFTLPSYRWPDAQRTLIARATMLDGYTTNPGANLNLIFANNGATPWTPNAFSPRMPVPAAAHPDHLVVAAAGDGAIDNQQAANASNEVAALDPDLFLYLGDVYNVGSVAEYYNWYGSPPGTNSGGSLACPGSEGCGNWGRFYSITNPAAGVHEYNAPPVPGQTSGTTETGYVDYWGMHAGPDAAGNVERHYYSYDAGNCTAGGSPCWHFVSLDSTDSFRCGSNAESACNDANSAGWNSQYTWLENDLATHSNDCTIAYWHHPYWGMKSRDEDGVTVAGGVDVRLTDLYQLMYQNGVDVLLTGHQHNFQRWKPLDAAGDLNDTYGITEIVDGAGGHPFGYFTRSDPRLASGIDRSGDGFQNGADVGPSPNGNPSGIIDLNLYADHADYSYRLAGDPGNPNNDASFDSAQIPCHGAPPDATPPGQPTNIHTSAVGPSNVDLTWTAPPDGDVAGYDVFRTTGIPPSCVEKCVLVGSTDGTDTTFSDPHVSPSTAYTYAVRARDTSGNVSPLSSSTVVATPSQSAFSDDFESPPCSGPVTGWTKVVRLTKTPTTGGSHAGSCEAAFAGTDGLSHFASETLSTPQPSVYTQMAFRLDSQSTPVSLLKMKSTNGGAGVGPTIYSVSVGPTGNLLARNELTKQTTRTQLHVQDSSWHTLTVHVTTGATPHVDVWVDGNPVSQLSKDDTLGPNAVASVQVGENLASRTFSGALDDVNVDSSPIAP